MPLNKPEPAWDDARLVEACLEGRAAAWEALIEKYKRLIYAIPFRYGAKADDAADIFQEVCLDLYKELPKLRQAGALRGWLATVAARRSLRWKRLQTRLGEDSLEDAPFELIESTPASEEVRQLERGQIVWEAIQRVPERCRELMNMLFYEDPPKPYEEIARALGLARGSIGFIRGRCLGKLRKALVELGF